jgi:hypothetical protein
LSEEKHITVRFPDYEVEDWLRERAIEQAKTSLLYEGCHDIHEVEDTPEGLHFKGYQGEGARFLLRKMKEKDNLIARFVEMEELRRMP